MEQNTNLRKQYMKKCEELFTLSAKAERDKYDQLQTSKDLMKVKQILSILNKKMTSSIQYAI